MSTEETRIQEMKEVIHEKIDSIKNIGLISDIYGEIVGCKDCPFMWSCHKKVPCSKSITNYIRKGEIL